MKLTKTQLETLRLMQQPGCVVHYMSYMGRFNPHAYYFDSITHKKCTRQIDALLKKGLAERYAKEFGGDHKVRLTEAGKNFK